MCCSVCVWVCVCDRWLPFNVWLFKTNLNVNDWNLKNHFHKNNNLQQKLTCQKRIHFPVESIPFVFVHTNNKASRFVFETTIFEWCCIVSVHPKWYCFQHKLVKSTNVKCQTIGSISGCSQWNCLEWRYTAFC